MDLITVLLMSLIANSYEYVDDEFMCCDFSIVEFNNLKDDYDVEYCQGNLNGEKHCWIKIDGRPLEPQTGTFIDPNHYAKRMNGTYNEKICYSKIPYGAQEWVKSYGDLRSKRNMIKGVGG